MEIHMNNVSLLLNILQYILKYSVSSQYFVIYMSYYMKQSKNM